MKKAYQKPALYAECFEMVEHVTSCSPMGRANHTDGGSCYYDAGGGSLVFLETGSSGCNYDPFDGAFEAEDLPSVLPEDCYGGYFQDDAMLYS